MVANAADIILNSFIPLFPFSVDAPLPEDPLPDSFFKDGFLCADHDGFENNSYWREVTGEIESLGSKTIMPYTMRPVVKMYVRKGVSDRYLLVGTYGIKLKAARNEKPISKNIWKCPAQLSQQSGASGDVCTTLMLGSVYFSK